MTKPGKPINFTYNLRSAMARLSEAPQRTVSVVQAALSGGVSLVSPSAPPPPHVASRLENVFEGLSELQFQPSVPAAFDLACALIAGELPSESIVAGLHDIDSDEICFVTARGAHADLLRGTAMGRSRCLPGPAAEHPVITTGALGAADWIGNTESSPVLLCPILDDHVLLGALVLADPLNGIGYTSHDADLTRYVAGQLAQFISAQRQAARRPKVPEPPRK